MVLSVFHPCFIRACCLFFIVIFASSGCRSKAPYQGKSVAQLRRMLHDADSKIQVQGAFGLSQLGSPAREALPELLEALKSDDPLVRQNAALALGAIGPDAAEAVLGLTEALHDGQWPKPRLRPVGKFGEHHHWKPETNPKSKGPKSKISSKRCLTRDCLETAL